MIKVWGGGIHGTLLARIVHDKLYPGIKIFSHRCESDKGLQATIVNQTCHSRNEGSLKIPSTKPIYQHIFGKQIFDKFYLPWTLLILYAFSINEILELSGFNKRFRSKARNGHKQDFLTFSTELFLVLRIVKILKCDDNQSL